MVLFYYLVSNNYDFVAVHFNHQKRLESVLDHELILDQTTKYNVPYHYIKLSIKSGNFQEEARILRHKHLIDIANKYQSKDIITAHHGDDLVETILMKLIRGSNLLGYAGMQKKSVINQMTFHKPLLDYTKEEIYDYAHKHNILFNEDVSNKTNDYFRNRLRNNVIPLIKEENNITLRFNNFSRQAHLASDFIRQETIKFLNNDLSFNLSKYNLLHEAIKNDILSYFFEVSNAEKSFDKITKIIKQLNTVKPNIEINISKDFSIIKSYEIISLVNKQKLMSKNSEIELNISHNKTDFPYNSIELCYNELSFPIKFRYRLPGDQLSFSFGHKKLKSYLIEKKIPKHLRDKLIIVTDSNDTILWIPELYINKTLGDDNSIYLSIKE